jgi:DNA-binding FadR family transcriptional regulator
MERMGLVSRIAEDLERVISQGRLPRDRSLPSEQLLSRQYGVSRTTVREALSHLSARGLIVQRPGRRSRAVVLDETVTLENLGVALHGEGPAHPERRRLLEGFFALKRELTVELLAACCEHASKRELDQLKDACFSLRDAARWEADRGRWAAWDFELLRRAARAADRPGHLLLIHSLERSFWGMAGRVLPHLDSASVCRWAECALYALEEKDSQALRRDLLPLLNASDELLLGGREPAAKSVDTPAVPASEPPTSELPTSEGPTAAAPPSEVLTDTGPTSSVGWPCGDGPAPESDAGEGLAGSVLPNRSDCQTGLCETRPAGGLSPEPASTGSCHPPGHAAIGTESPPEHQGSHAFPSAPSSLLKNGAVDPPER